jgi:hypothetical protein
MRPMLATIIALVLTSPVFGQDLLDRVKALEASNAQVAADLTTIKSDIAAIKRMIYMDPATKAAKADSTPGCTCLITGVCTCPSCGCALTSADNKLVAASTLGETLRQKAVRTGQTLYVGVGMDAVGNGLTTRDDTLQTGISGPHIVIAQPIDGKLMWVGTQYPVAYQSTPVYYGDPMAGGNGACAGGVCNGLFAPRGGLRGIRGGGGCANGSCP